MPQFQTVTSKLMAEKTLVDPPTLRDWQPIDDRDLDAKWTFETFLGKTAAQARDMFRENSLHYQEGLYSMPPAPLAYYATAFVDYLASPQAQGDCNGAFALLELAHWALGEGAAQVPGAVRSLLLRAAREVATKQEALLNFVWVTGHEG